MPRRYDRDYGADFEEPVTTTTSTIRIQKTRNHTTPRDVENDVYDNTYNPQTQLVSDPSLSRSLRPAGMPARSTGSHPTMRKDMQQVERRRPRPNTDEDNNVDTRRVVAQSQHNSPRYSRRSLLLMGAGGVIGFICASELLGSWILSNADHLKYELNIGSHPAAEPLTLVCGHHDSPQNPTEIHAYLVGSGDNACIEFVEYPGGNFAHPFGWHSQTIRSMGYNGDLSQMKIYLVPQVVAPGKYQIELRLILGGVGVNASSQEKDVLFVDKGDHFEPAIKNQ